MATAIQKNKNQLTAYSASQISIAVNLAATGNTAEAEKALVAISDSIGGKDGDKALVLALAKVPGTTMMQILTTTGSHPSAIVPALITPKQLAKALIDLPKKWVTEQNPDYKGDCGELLNGVILRGDLEDGEVGIDATAFFKALEGHVAASVLALALLDNAGEILDYQARQLDEDGDDRMAGSDLEWQTAVYKMRKANPDLFKAVCEALGSESEEESEENSSGEPKNSVRVTASPRIIQGLLGSVMKNPLQVAVATADEAL